MRIFSFPVPQGQAVSGPQLTCQLQYTYMLFSHQAYQRLDMFIREREHVEGFGLGDPVLLREHFQIARQALRTAGDVDDARRRQAQG